MVDEDKHSLQQVRVSFELREAYVVNQRFSFVTFIAGRISTQILFCSTPLLGFAAIYVMAHEVGHNLGMVHDDKAGCAKEGFIMSPTRGSTGETEWSECSAEILRKGPGHDCLLEEERQPSNGVDVNEDRLPGQIWSPRAQCQVVVVDNALKFSICMTYNICCTYFSKIFLLEPSAKPFRNQRPAER